VLVTGPTNPMTLVAAAFVAANILPTGKVNLAVVVTCFLLAGALQVLLGVLRLGGFVRYVLMLLKKSRNAFWLFFRKNRS
jgi:SulP family sulfate permease